MSSIELKRNPNRLEKNKSFVYKGVSYMHYADIAFHQSAYYLFTKKQKILIVVLLFAISVSFIVNWHATLVSAVILVTSIYFIDFFFNFFLIFRSFTSKHELSFTEKEIKAHPKDWPSYTILCPLYKEWAVIPQFVDAMKKLDYPQDKLQILFLLEEDDLQSQKVVREFNLPSFFETVIVPHSLPKTKPKAMNFALSRIKGEYCVIYDAEDVPDPLQLKKAILGFNLSGEKVACIQAKLNFYNPKQNLLTKAFTAEYSLWFELILPGLQTLNAPIPLGGTSNHFRTEGIKMLGGWDPFNVTEDADLGIRLFKKGYKTAILDSVTLEEANSDFLNWYNQRTRWIKGYIQTYVVHMRHPTTFDKGLLNPNMLLFQLIIGSKVFSLLVNPFMWLLTFAYFLFQFQFGSFVQSLYPPVVLYFAVATLVFGNFLQIVYYMIGCYRKKEFALCKYALIIPLYWVGMSIAAWKALYETFYKPYYWSKTKHGLHLEKPSIATNS